MERGRPTSKEVIPPAPWEREYWETWEEQGITKDQAVKQAEEQKKQPPVKNGEGEIFTRR